MQQTLSGYRIAGYCRLVQPAADHHTYTERWEIQADSEGRQVGFMHTPDSSFQEATVVITVADGSHLIGRKLSFADSAGTFAEKQFWVEKRSSGGQLQWNARFQGSSSGPSVVHCLLATPDGGYLIGGTTYTPVVVRSLPGHGRTEIWLIKLGLPALPAVPPVALPVAEPPAPTVDAV